LRPAVCGAGSCCRLVGEVKSRGVVYLGFFSGGQGWVRLLGFGVGGDQGESGFGEEFEAEVGPPSILRAGARRAFSESDEEAVGAIRCDS